MNYIVLTGNITRDPEERASNSGKKIARFSIAVRTGRRDESGNQLAEFFDVVCFDKIAEYVLRFCRKGSKVLVSGNMQSHKAQKNMTTVTYWEVAASNVEGLSPKDEQQPYQQPYQPRPQQYPQKPQGSNLDAIEPDPDDLPF